ncbi:MAG TPA: ribose 5-phosphate isomerase B [Flavobacteriaceae bacterium]|nr:ribose 5-phosphate isomerase B [Flavobacteriaceae bacterium]
MKIAIGNDHAGTEFKNMILEKLKKKGYKVENFGTDKTDSVDYPDFVHPVAQAVENKDVDFGIVICGSGNGASMTANKHAGVRCALCWNEEITALARQHNDANILSLPARFITLDEADKMVDVFFETDFEGGRHERRVDKMPWK